MPGSYTPHILYTCTHTNNTHRVHSLAFGQNLTNYGHMCTQTCAHMHIYTPTFTKPHNHTCRYTLHHKCTHIHIHPCTTHESMHTHKHACTYMKRLPNITELLTPLEEAIRHQLIPAITGRSTMSDTERDVLALPCRLGGMGIINKVNQ